MVISSDMVSVRSVWSLLEVNWFKLHAVICLKGQLNLMMMVTEPRLHIPEQWRYVVGRSSTSLSCVRFQLQLCRVDIDQLVLESQECYLLEAQPVGSLHGHSTLSVTLPGHRSPQYTPGSVTDENFIIICAFSSSTLTMCDNFCLPISHWF
jgi:hypothetical protein